MMMMFHHQVHLDFDFWRDIFNPPRDERRPGAGEARERLKYRAKQRVNKNEISAAVTGNIRPTRPGLPAESKSCSISPSNTVTAWSRQIQTALVLTGEAIAAGELVTITIDVEST